MLLIISLGFLDALVAQSQQLHNIFIKLIYYNDIMLVKNFKNIFL